MKLEYTPSEIDGNNFYVANNSKYGYALRMSCYSTDRLTISRLNMDNSDYIKLAKKCNGNNLCTTEYPSIYFKESDDVFKFFKELEPYIIASKFL